MDKQFPSGVKDLFFEEAAEKSLLEGRLCRTFVSWGYWEVIPPTFEHYDN